MRVSGQVGSKRRCGIAPKHAAAGTAGRAYNEASTLRRARRQLAFPTMRDDPQTGFDTTSAPMTRSGAVVRVLLAGVCVVVLGLVWMGYSQPGLLLQVAGLRYCG